MHSHIDCGAYFSQEDKHQMTLPDNSGPVFPADNYLVVSVDQGKPGETAVFIYDEAAKDFMAGSLVIKDRV